MKRAVPNHNRASITYRVNAWLTHFPVPQLVIPPNKQWFFWLFFMMKLAHSLIEGRLSGCRFYRTPGEFPSHGRDEFHRKKDSRHAWVEVWVDEPGTDYVIRKTVINSVRFGVQPWLHVLYCSDFNDSLIFD